MSLSVMLFWVRGPVCSGGGIEDTLFGGGSGIITDPSMLFSFLLFGGRRGTINYLAVGVASSIICRWEWRHH